MLYTETVEAGTLDLIKRFMLDEAFKEFRLVGGTALSLTLVIVFLLILICFVTLILMQQSSVSI